MLKMISRPPKPPTNVPWKFISALHAQAQPYNLLYLPGRVFVFPRKTQGTVDVPAWSSGFTWYELSGGFVVFNRDEYKNLRAADIENYLHRLRIDSNFSAPASSGAATTATRCTAIIPV